MDIDLDIPAGASAECLALDFGSAAARRQHGVARPRLTSIPGTRCSNSGSIASSPRWRRPRVGSGLAVLLAGPPPEPDSPGAPLALVVELVWPALLVMDSPSGDLTESRTVAAVLGVVPGQWDPAGIRTAGCLVRRNGELAATGAPGALLNSPVAALAALAGAARAAGLPSPTGQCILLGSITPTVPAEAGDRFNLWIGGLGSVTTRLGVDAATGDGR